MRIIDRAVSLVLERREAVSPDRAALVALSGIDGSGKGHVAARLAQALQRRGLGTVVIGVDPWLALPSVRFASEAPAAHFYAHAIRFDALFSQLLRPLQRDRRIHLVADTVSETSTTFVPRTYSHRDVDVVVVEGIFLLKRELKSSYDLALWLDCPFEKALERALVRRQEGLGPVETIRAYRTIYFPAQRLHMALDAPREGADAVLPN